MKQYLLSIYQPDGDPPPEVDLEKIMVEVRAWNQQLRDAGAWVFTGLLHDASTSTVVQVRDGELFTTDGPYVEGKEHIGGFEIISVDDLDAALNWARGFSEITGLPVEVRPMREDDGA